MNGSESHEKSNEVAARLLELMDDLSAELFHDSRRTAYVSFLCENHKETWPLDSTEFESMVNHLYYQKYRHTPSEQGLRRCLNTLNGRALFEG